MHRLFFALWPGAKLRHELLSRATRLLSPVEGRRLAAQDWHVTLCFIGAVNEAALSALLANASAAALTCAPFALRFDCIEYWPEARVVAATATEVPAPAVELASALRAMTRELGLAPDEKPLRPHLTLMRGVNPLAWQMKQAGEGPLRPALLLMADALHLAESRPAPQKPGAGGARGLMTVAPSYLQLASWPLGAAGAGAERN